MSFFKNEIEYWKKVIRNLKKEKTLMKVTAAYLVIAFIFLDFLFGIMKTPYRDINTLSPADRTEFLKVTKEFRARRAEIRDWERMDAISGYVDPDVPIIIKKLKKENAKPAKKRWEIYAKADYKAWQYRFSKFMKWEFPFRLHSR